MTSSIGADEVTVTVEVDVLQVFPIGDFDVAVSAAAPDRALRRRAGAPVMSVRCRGDRGDSGPLEVVILLPAVLLLFAMVVAFGRTTTASQHVEHAAAVGARAAAGAQTAGGAGAGGRRGRRSQPRPARHDAARRPRSAGTFTPGGRVSVTVTCTVDLGDVTRLGFLPGSRTLTATASEVIDRTRGG